MGTKKIRIGMVSTIASALAIGLVVGGTAPAAFAASAYVDGTMSRTWSTQQYWNLRSSSRPHQATMDPHDGMRTSGLPEPAGEFRQ